MTEFESHYSHVMVNVGVMVECTLCPSEKWPSKQISITQQKSSVLSAILDIITVNHSKKNGVSV